MKPTCLALLLSVLSLPALAQAPFTAHPLAAEPYAVVAVDKQLETQRRRSAEYARQANRAAEYRQQQWRAAQRREHLRLDWLRKRQQAEQAEDQRR